MACPALCFLLPMGRATYGATNAINQRNQMKKLLRFAVCMLLSLYCVESARQIHNQSARTKNLEARITWLESAEHQCMSHQSVCDTDRQQEQKNWRDIVPVLNKLADAQLDQSQIGLMEAQAIERHGKNIEDLYSRLAQDFGDKPLPKEAVLWATDKDRATNLIISYPAKEVSK